MLKKVSEFCKRRKLTLLSLFIAIIAALAFVHFKNLGIDYKNFLALSLIIFMTAVDVLILEIL